MKACGVSPAHLFALVPCAGVGERAGAGRPKQYVDIGPRPMVRHTLDALGQVARLAGTLVVLSAEDEAFDRLVPDWCGPGRWTARRGGATRAATVLAGLGSLQERGAREDDWVLVHDAARCLVRAQWIDRLIDACLDDEVGGLLALPLADTLKEAAGGRVAATVARDGKWAAQTPQMFRIGLLRRALLQSGQAVTDESSAVEALGLRPILVPGELENLKVTYPADFELAARLLAGRTLP